nr:MAG TPA: hypothetical protein [Caudoviricetes sp.]
MDRNELLIDCQGVFSDVEQACGNDFNNTCNILKIKEKRLACSKL